MCILDKDSEMACQSGSELRSKALDKSHKLQQTTTPTKIRFLTMSSAYFSIRWLNPLFGIGYKRQLEEDDMYEVLEEDGSERLGQDLNRYRGCFFQKFIQNTDFLLISSQFSDLFG